MATLKQKIAAEQKVRELLAASDVPFPDEIEYGYTCIRLFWLEPKVVLVVDIDEPPEDLDGLGWDELSAGAEKQARADPFEPKLELDDERASSDCDARACRRNSDGPGRGPASGDCGDSDSGTKRNQPVVGTRADSTNDRRPRLP